MYTTKTIHESVPVGCALSRRAPCCRVREQQDVLRPYCSLLYAWDEPAQPHRLVLELPGARPLGTFDLDKVRARPAPLSLPAGAASPGRTALPAPL